MRLFYRKIARLSITLAMAGLYIVVFAWPWARLAEEHEQQLLAKAQKVQAQREAAAQA